MRKPSLKRGCGSWFDVSAKAVPGLKWKELEIVDLSEDLRVGCCVGHRPPWMFYREAVDLSRFIFERTEDHDCLDR
jgi:hypothetical protein